MTGTRRGADHAAAGAALATAPARAGGQRPRPREAAGGAPDVKGRDRRDKKGESAWRRHRACEPRLHQGRGDERHQVPRPRGRGRAARQAHPRVPQRAPQPPAHHDGARRRRRDRARPRRRSRRWARASSRGSRRSRAQAAADVRASATNDRARRSRPRSSSARTTGARRARARSTPSQIVSTYLDPNNDGLIDQRELKAAFALARKSLWRRRAARDRARVGARAARNAPGVDRGRRGERSRIKEPFNDAELDKMVKFLDPSGDGIIEYPRAARRRDARAAAEGRGEGHQGGLVFQGGDAHLHRAARPDRAERARVVRRDGRLQRRALGRQRHLPRARSGSRARSAETGVQLTHRGRHVELGADAVRAVHRHERRERPDVRRGERRARDARHADRGREARRAPRRHLRSASSTRSRGCGCSASSACSTRTARAPSRPPSCATSSRSSCNEGKCARSSRCA